LLASNKTYQGRSFSKTDIKISLGEPITMSKIDPTMIGTELLKYS